MLLNVQRFLLAISLAEQRLRGVLRFAFHACCASLQYYFLAINFAAQKTSVCALRFPLLKAESACVAFDSWLLVKAHVAGVNKGLLDFYFGFGHSSRDVELRTRIIDYSYMCV